MKIHVYECPDAPPKKRALAVFFDGGQQMPVVHYGADPATVRANAQAWWDAEHAKAQAKFNRPRKKAADPGDII